MIKPIKFVFKGNNEGKFNIFAQVSYISKDNKKNI